MSVIFSDAQNNLQIDETSALYFAKEENLNPKEGKMNQKGPRIRLKKFMQADIY